MDYKREPSPEEKAYIESMQHWQDSMDLELTGIILDISATEMGIDLQQKILDLNRQRATHTKHRMVVGQETLNTWLETNGLI